MMELLLEGLSVAGVIMVMGGIGIFVAGRVGGVLDRRRVRREWQRQPIYGPVRVNLRKVL